MKKRLLFPVLFLATLLFVRFTIPDSRIAILQWIEEFDGTLEDWTVYIGGFTMVPEGYPQDRLYATGDYQNYASRASTNAYGFWSFDIYSWDTYLHGGWEVFFIALDVANLDYPSNGYYLRTERGEYQLVLMENNVRRIMDGYKNTTLGDDSRSIYEMMHVEIVRRYDGYLYVWLNRTTNEIFIDNWPVHENTFSASAFFFISFWHNYTTSHQWIDNIRVDNNPDNGPPPPPYDDELPMVLLVTPWAIGLCLVVGGFLVWRRRQKKVIITPGEEIKDSE
ncbi:MAG: hypothetical protein ACFFBR_03825 [Promethearchaeota archaeon]